MTPLKDKARLLDHWYSGVMRSCIDDMMVLTSWEAFLKQNGHDPAETLNQGKIKASLPTSHSTKKRNLVRMEMEAIASLHIIRTVRLRKVLTQISINLKREVMQEDTYFLT